MQNKWENESFSQNAITDSSMEDGSPRKYIIDTWTLHDEDFILDYVVNEMGDDFIPALSFLVPPLIEATKEIPTGDYFDILSS